MVVSDQDKLRSRQFVRQRVVKNLRQEKARVTPTLHIALRFLSTANAPFVLSLCGVVFGVAIFICTRRRPRASPNVSSTPPSGVTGPLCCGRNLVRASSAICCVAPKTPAGSIRRRYFEGITNASEIMRISRRFPNVVACAPVLRGTLTARAEFETATVDLFGIDPALHLRTTDIGQQIIAGKFA